MQRQKNTQKKNIMIDLKQIRSDYGMTQSAMADIMQSATYRIGLIERGIQPMRESEERQLRQFLGERFEGYCFEGLTLREQVDQARLQRRAAKALCHARKNKRLQESVGCGKSESFIFLLEDLAS